MTWDKYGKDCRDEGFDEGSQKERIKAIQNMLELDIPKEQILKKYSEEEYEKAIEDFPVTV